MKSPVSAESRREFEHRLLTLLVAHGAVDSSDLPVLVERCVEQMLEALASSTADGTSLSALDVVRIRASKFAATRLPPSLYRDTKALAALRADIQQLALDFLGETGAQGSRFLSAHRRTGESEG